MVSVAPRNLLGTFGYAERISVYLAPDSVEFEARGVADIERRRIYLDDIAMVTRCKRLNWWLLVPSSIMCMMTLPGGLILLAVGMGSDNRGGADVAFIFGVGMLAAAMVLLIQIISHLVRQDDIITIFGRRKKVEIRFGFFKKQKCEENFVLLTDAVARAGVRTREKYERERPPDLLDLDPGAEMAGWNAQAVPEAQPVAPVAPMAPLAPVKMLTKFVDGQFVEYNPQAMPRSKTTGMIRREAELPFLPEIKPVEKIDEADVGEKKAGENAP